MDWIGLGWSPFGLCFDYFMIMTRAPAEIPTISRWKFCSFVTQVDSIMQIIQYSMLKIMKDEYIVSAFTSMKFSFFLP